MPLMAQITGLLAAVILAVSSLAAAQTMPPPAPTLPAGALVEYDPDAQTLTARVTALPLRQLLGIITAKTDIRFQAPDPRSGFDNRPVTASFERLELERAIKRLLGPSNTIMLYDTQRPEGARHAAIRLTEVRVFDLGVIPSAATAVAPQASEPSPRVLHRQLLPAPEQTQTKRAAEKEKREEKRQGRQEKQERSEGGRAASQGQGRQPTPSKAADAAQSADQSNQAGQTKKTP